mmetsp:Transcript_13988/g.38477  ORF Transcript_13988/g.38477 Transcript_13988/m.38477 type:complete len:218 (+) Transcript_13988:194-847(+)
MLPQHGLLAQHRRRPRRLRPPLRARRGAARLRAQHGPELHAAATPHNHLLHVAAVPGEAGRVHCNYVGCPLHSVGRQLDLAAREALLQHIANAACPGCVHVVCLAGCRCHGEVVAGNNSRGVADEGCQAVACRCHRAAEKLLRHGCRAQLRGRDPGRRQGLGQLPTSRARIQPERPPTYGPDGGRGGPARIRGEPAGSEAGGHGHGGLHPRAHAGRQ